MKAKQFIDHIRFKTNQFFVKKNYPTAKCGYILEKRANWHSNILEPKVADFIESEEKNKSRGKTFALHKYIHHGLSSQACLFNLLGPFVVDKSYNVLKNVINLAGINLEGEVNLARFEHTEREIFNELRKQPTSVDFYLETTKGEIIITEFKFTESEFGTCSVYESGDCDGVNPFKDFNLCYLHKNEERTYMKLMNKYNLFWDSNPCQFTEFYQAYRLLLFALAKKGYFLFIYDERNPAFIYNENGNQRGKYTRFLNLLPEELKKKVFKLSIQQIVEYLENSIKPEWIEEFKEKYI